MVLPQEFRIASIPTVGQTIRALEQSMQRQELSPSLLVMEFLWRDPLCM